MTYLTYIPSYKCTKNPIEYGYIISSRQCTTKPLAKAAMLGLKLCQSQNQAYCKAIKQYTGINMFFITDNFQKIANWVSSYCEGTCGFDAKSLKTLIRFIIKNSYFVCGDKILRPTICIPMGLDPAPQMANGHLHKYEFDFNKKWLRVIMQ